MSTLEKMQENICETLTSDACDHSYKLQTIQSLKQQFKSPDKIFSRLKLDLLLQRARFSLEHKVPDKKFLFNYGTSLLYIIGQYANLEAEVLQQLEYILVELKKVDESITDVLVTKLWSTVQNGSIFEKDNILNVSKNMIERAVLNWMDTTGDPEVEFLSEMCADSPKLFQTVTSLLFEILVRTSFHKKVLEVQGLFILAVKRVCLLKEKNFLGLYPKGCCRLVSLLRVPPKIYSCGAENVIIEVVSLLLEMFISNRRKAIILLSHYPEWISIFKLNFEQISV